MGPKLVENTFSAGYSSTFFGQSNDMYLPPRPVVSLHVMKTFLLFLGDILTSTFGTQVHWFRRAKSSRVNGPRDFVWNSCRLQLRFLCVSPKKPFVGAVSPNAPTALAGWPLKFASSLRACCRLLKIGFAGGSCRLPFLHFVQTKNPDVSTGQGSDQRACLTKKVKVGGSWSMKFQFEPANLWMQSDSVLWSVNSSAVCVSLQVCMWIWHAQFGQLGSCSCFALFRRLALFDLVVRCSCLSLGVSTVSFAKKALQLRVALHAVTSMDCENLKTDLNSYGTFLGLRYCRGTGAIRLMYCTIIALVLSLIRIICDLAMGFAIVHRASWTFLMASLIDFLLAVVSSTAAWFAVKKRTYGLTIFAVVSFLWTALYSVTYFVIIIIESRLPENQ